MLSPGTHHHSDHRTLARVVAPGVAATDGGPIENITGFAGVPESVDPPNNNGYERTLCWEHISQAVQALTPFADVTAAANAGFDTSRSFKFEPFTPVLPNPLGDFYFVQGMLRKNRFWQSKRAKEVLPTQWQGKRRFSDDPLFSTAFGRVPAIGYFPSKSFHVSGKSYRDKKRALLPFQALANGTECAILSGRRSGAQRGALEITSARGFLGRPLQFVNVLKLLSCL